MTTAAQVLAKNQHLADRLGIVLALFALLLAPLGLLADKAVVPLVLVAALGGGAVLGKLALPWRVIDRRLAGALILLAAWWLITALWSIHPPAAAALALRVGVLLLALLYLTGLMQLLGDQQRKRVVQAFCLGLGAAFALALIDLLFGTPIFTLLEGRATSERA